MSEAERIERMLRSALVPVEPPARLTDRLEPHLAEITSAAAGELAEWELSAMRDPRNWARPASAMVVGSVAGGALVVVRARQRQRKRHARRRGAVERGARELSDELQRFLRG